MAPNSPQSTQDRILETALRMFAAHGIAAVPLRAIAAEVGLHNSTLFHYFSSKRELSSQLLERVIGRTAALVEPLDRDDPPQLDTLLGVIREIAAHFAEHPEEASFILRDQIDCQESGLLDTDTSDPRNPIYRLFASVWGWLDRARRTGAIRPVRIAQTARILFGILLYDPAAEVGNQAPGATRRAPDKIRLQRLDEVEAFVHAALAPLER